MKRTLALVLALLMIFCMFAACGEKEKKESGTTGTEQNQGSSTGNNSAAGTNDKEDVTAGNVIDVGKGYPSFFELKADQVAPSDSEVLDIAFSAEPPSLNPLISGQGVAMYGVCFMYDMLFQYNSRTSELIPWLATSYEWVEDTEVKSSQKEATKTKGRVNLSKKH